MNKESKLTGNKSESIYSVYSCLLFLFMTLSIIYTDSKIVLIESFCLHSDQISVVVSSLKHAVDVKNNAKNTINFNVFTAIQFFAAKVQKIFKYNTIKSLHHCKICCNNAKFKKKSCILGDDKNANDCILNN